MTVDQIPSPLYPEVPVQSQDDILAKPSPVDSGNEEEQTIEANKQARKELKCLFTLSTLACLILVIVLLTLLVFIPFSGTEFIAVSFLLFLLKGQHFLLLYQF
jgi:hypothetical protein